jgi:hypothetical protein
MAIGLPPVQTAETHTSATGAKALAFPSNNTAGNLLVAALIVEDNTATVTTFADSLGNTWTALGTLFGAGNGYRQRIYYVKNCLGGANTVTVTPSAAVAVNFQINEYSGAHTTAPSEGANEASGSGGSPNSGDVTTTQTGDLIFCMMSSGIAGTVGGGFTAVGGSIGWNQNCFAEDKLAGAAGLYAGFWSIASGVWLVSVAAFKDTGVGGGAPRRALTTMGIG